MRFYPRFLRKELISEYVPDLAPPKELLQELKSRSKVLGDHNAAFLEVGYPERFTLSERGWQKLRQVLEQSRHKNVWLICQCSSEQMCHCDLLLKMAQNLEDSPE